MTGHTVHRVVVTREDGAWLADIPSLPGAHTYSRTLTGLDQAVREVVVLAVDLPDDEIPHVRLDYVFHTGDPELDDVAAEVRALRTRADELATAAAARTLTAAEALVSRGFSVRDVAALLGISPQRVSQLTRRHAG